MRNSVVASTLAALLLATSAAAHADAPLASTEASSSSSSSDSQPTHWNGIHFNIGAALFGELSLGYERVLSSRVSLEIDGAALAASGTNDQGGATELEAYFVGFRPHFYFVQNAPAGLYISPFVQAGRGSFTDGAAGKVTGSILSAGATMGYSLVLGGFNLKAGLGLEEMRVGLKVTDQDGTRAGVGAGLGLTGDLSVGAVF